MSDPSLVMREVYSIIPEKVFEEIEYDRRGRPADSLKVALEIADVWINDEVEAAITREDNSAIINLGWAAAINYSQSTTSPECIRMGSAARRVIGYLNTQSGQQG